MSLQRPHGRLATREDTGDDQVCCRLGAPRRRAAAAQTRPTPAIHKRVLQISDKCVLWAGSSHGARVPTRLSSVGRGLTLRGRWTLTRCCGESACVQNGDVDAFVATGLRAVSICLPSPLLTVANPQGGAVAGMPASGRGCMCSCAWLTPVMCDCCRSGLLLCPVRFPWSCVRQGRCAYPSRQGVI
jgi:hypothetical protein